jgi:hypothetical protein
VKSGGGVTRDRARCRHAGYRRAVAAFAACVTAVCLMMPSTVAAGAGQQRPGQPSAGAVVPATAEHPGRIEEARQKYEDEAAAYWASISQMRRLRNAKRRDHQEILLSDYVLTQPPAYVGPSRSVELSPPPEKPPETVPKYVPVVADFLKSAEDYFGYMPQRPKREAEFRRAYAQAAAVAGLTRDQAVRVYGFESGGNGTYDVQAGLEYATPGAHAISPALGYNQLLNTNSVELLAEQGNEFVTTLKIRAAHATGAAKRVLDGKTEVLRHMIEFCRSVPDEWAAHDALANTPRGLGVHALVLDIDVGPLLQAAKLQNSVLFARRKGFQATLSAAELELMNLTGDGNGFDMVMMPAAMRARVPTANFFQRSGYERNPVASRNNVVSKLFAAINAKMDKEVSLPGARDLAAAF